MCLQGQCHHLYGILRHRNSPFETQRTKLNMCFLLRLFLSVLLVDRVLKGSEEDWMAGTTDSLSEWLFHTRHGPSLQCTAPRRGGI